MFLPGAFDHRAAGSKLSVQTLRGVACDRQAAALFRAVVRERGDEGMAAGTYGVPDLLDIPGSGGFLRQEVECGAIVPDIE